ncbi:UNVERIFIED_CONTAM: hypothetical protein K2H54_056923 [Gekko kuhli]
MWMQETYLLTQGPRRESLFDMEALQGFGASEAGGATAGPAWITDCMKERKDYLLTEEDKEEGEVEQRLSALEKAQGKFHQDLEAVIQTIPDMVVRALRVEREAQQAPGCLATGTRGPSQLAKRDPGGLCGERSIKSSAVSTKGAKRLKVEIGESAS